MPLNDRARARDVAISAMEDATRYLIEDAMAYSSSSSVEILDSRHDTSSNRAGIAEATSLAEAAIASAMAEQQRDQLQPEPVEPFDTNVRGGAMDYDVNLDDSVFHNETVAVDGNEEVGNNYPISPATPRSQSTYDPLAWAVTPNLHPCQAPPFVTYTNCGHDYTRSDERIIYDSSSSGYSPKFVGEWCTSTCHVPKRCVRHFPFTHGCPACLTSPINSSFEDFNGTPTFIRIGVRYPGDENRAYTDCETGMLSEIQWNHSPFFMSPVQDWVDATPSPTSSSDVERHEEIRRQSIINNYQTVSPCSTNRINAYVQATLLPKFEFKLILRLSFQDASSIVTANDPLDEWTLAQIANGNKDLMFLEATREERMVLMAEGMWPLEAPHPSDRPGHPVPEETDDDDLDSDDTVEYH